MRSAFRRARLLLPESIAERLFGPILDVAIGVLVAAFEQWRADGFYVSVQHENYYNARMVGYFNTISEGQSLGLRAGCESYEHPDAVFDGDANPLSSPRMDIRIAWGLVADNRYLTVECKRVAPGDLAREYVADGMTRFKRGEYSPKDRTGGMIGYLIAGDPAAVAQEISERATRAFGVDEGLINAPLSCLETSYRSTHVRIGFATPFAIVHLHLIKQ